MRGKYEYTRKKGEPVVRSRKRWAERPDSPFNKMVKAQEAEAAKEAEAQDKKKK